MQLLTVREVAVTLNCSVTHVYNLIRSRVLAAENIAAAGKRPSWRIPPAALEEFRTNSGGG
jgi:excisionase family DNA binding protein